MSYHDDHATLCWTLMVVEFVENLWSIQSQSHLHHDQTTGSDIVAHEYIPRPHFQSLRQVL